MSDAVPDAMEAQAESAQAGGSGWAWRCSWLVSAAGCSNHNRRSACCFCPAAASRTQIPFPAHLAAWNALGHGNGNTATALLCVPRPLLISLRHVAARSSVTVTVTVTRARESCRRPSDRPVPAGLTAAELQLALH